MSVPPPEPPPREFDLDPFRGVVCLWLMGLHFGWLSEAHGPLLRLAGPDVADALFHVRLGVESFLVLAGFMMAHMLRPVPGEGIRFGAYFARRGYRLLLPFAAAVLLAAADRWAAHLLFDGGKDRPGVGEVVAQLLLVNEYVGVPEPAVGYWTLATLEQFYLLWLVGFAVVRRATAGDPGAAYRRAVARMGRVALAVFLASGAAFLGAGSLADHLPRYAFYIALGILLYGNARLGLHRWELRAAVAGMAGAAVWFQHSRLTAALVAVGVLYALAGGARFPGGRAVGALRYVGRRAYSLYLVHAVVGMRVLTGYRYVGRHGDWVAVPLVLAAAAASLAGAAVFFRWVERPCQDLARRVRYRATVPDPADSRPVVLAEPSR